MIEKYKVVSIIYGGSGKKYAELLNKKIIDISRENRYPISSKMVMDKILTHELLNEVIDIFRGSEICVTFLTADDVCLPFEESPKKFFQKKKIKKRVRQNVVFELGMAIYRFGRERCIILSDFDPKDINVELPSDWISLNICPFDEKTKEQVMDDVIAKILRLSNELKTTSKDESALNYSQLFRRNVYHVDYENIFKARFATIHSEGEVFLKEVLELWEQECNALPFYDEKCIYVLERIGFLPIFGNIPELYHWLEKITHINYSESDVNYYGSIDVLNFAKSLLINVVNYTQIKMKNQNLSARMYRELLEDFVALKIPNCTINPLILTVYYDYLGLTYMKLFQFEKNMEYMKCAQDAFEKAVKYSEKVDLGLRIWRGFISYNLARAFGILGQDDKAFLLFRESISIRQLWLSASVYNLTVKNALSYEYFIAKINYLDLCDDRKRLSKKEIENEYKILENELDNYCNSNDNLERLRYVRQMLQERKNTSCVR